MNYFNISIVKIIIFTIFFAFGFHSNLLAEGTVFVKITKCPTSINEGQLVDITVEFEYLMDNNNGPWDVLEIALRDEEFYLGYETIKSVSNPFKIYEPNQLKSYTFKDVRLSGFNDGGDGVDLYAFVELDDNVFNFFDPHGSSEVLQVNIITNNYEWDTGTWSSCNSECRKTRSVYCKNQYGTKVSDGLCNGSKPSSSSSCTGGDCKFNWSIGDWGVCDNNCNQTRRVVCKQSNDSEVSDEYCNSTRPITNRDCSGGDCNPNALNIIYESISPKEGELGTKFEWSIEISNEVQGINPELNITYPLNNEVKKFIMNKKNTKYSYSLALSQVGQYRSQVEIAYKGKNIISNNMPITVRVVKLDDDYPYNEDTSCDQEKCAVDPWGFCKRYCTSWVAWKVNQSVGHTDLNRKNYFFYNAMTYPPLSNAGNWNNTLLTQYEVNSSPRAGCIAEWDLGHVAYVHSVEDDGTTIIISEYNFDIDCSYGTRTISKESDKYPDKFIHIEGHGTGGTNENQDQISQGGGDGGGCFINSASTY